MNSIAVAAALALSAVVAACTVSGPPPPTAGNATATVAATASPATPTATATAAATTPTASPSGPPTVGRCDWPGADPLWEQLPPPVQAYTFAWTDRNDADRLAGLQEGMTDDGSFVDPTMDEPAVGHEALAAHIGEFLAARPGHYFAMRELVPADEHHGHIRLRWMLCNSGGQPVLEGEEVAELDSNGRITEVIRFLDTP